MKKIAYIGLAALMFGIASCDKIEDSENLPATNPQLPIVPVESVVVTPGAAIASGVDLSTATGSLQVASVLGGEDWPEGFTAEIPFMEISSTEDFAVSAPINAQMVDGDAYVLAGDWLEAHKLIFGKNPQTVKTYVRFAVNAVKDEQSVRMGGADVFYGAASLNVVPPANVVYVMGDACGWNFDDAPVLVASNDNDQYFSGFAYVNGGFKFTKEKNWDDGNWSAEGSTLVEGGDNITLSEAGLYWLTVDLENLQWSNTYVESIGCVGAFNGWNAADNVKLTPNANFTIWSGTVDFGDGGEWKLNVNGSWDISLGTNANNLEVGGGSGNLSVDAGTYEVTLYLDKVPYHVDMAKK